MRPNLTKTLGRIIPQGIAQRIQRRRQSVISWVGPPISFLHFEKCAGNSVVSWLAQYFHPAQINDEPARDASPHLLYRAPNGLRQMGAYAFIWGHYDLPSLQRIDPHRFVFTILREPGERLVSLYRYWRSIDPDRIDPDIFFNVSLAHRLSLEDFLRCDEPMIVDLIDNVYVRRLTGLYVTGAPVDPLAAGPEAALQQAKMALAGFGHIGFHEQLPQSMAILAARLGLRPPAKMPAENITADNHRGSNGWFRPLEALDISPAAKRAIEHRTMLDSQLYSEALRFF